MAKYDTKDFLLMPLTCKPEYAQAIHTLLFYMIDNKRAFQFPTGQPFTKNFKLVNKEQLERITEFMKRDFKVIITDEQIDKAISVYYTLLIY